jgi:hypothetical protein
MLNLSCDGQKHLIFAHLQLLFENRWGYNTQNQYQPIFCAKDLWVQTQKDQSQLDLKVISQWIW